MHKNVKDLKGMVFGELEVLRYSRPSKNGSIWMCKCSCGKEIERLGVSMIHGLTTSCGHRRGSPKEITWIVNENDCWICTSHSKDYDGYHLFKKEQKTIKIHRYMYEQKYGEIPRGMFACHKCDNPSCINPDHIFIGNVLDNNRDKEKKGRGVRLHGEQNHHAKLTEKEVIEIRKNTELNQRQLAVKYGVCFQAISDIIRRKTWKHVKEDFNV